MSESLPDGAESGPAEAEHLRGHLRALEAGRRALLDALPEGAAEVDAEGRIVACNQRFAGLCGATEAELIGRSLPEASAGRPVRLERRPLPPPAEGELVVAKAEAEKRLRGASGELLGDVGTIEDVTERKRGEEEKARRERKQQEAQKLESLCVLAGGVAHHFNNLLTGIIGYTSLARQQTPAGAPLGELLDQAVESAQRAADLCRQMLAYSGRGRFVVGPLDLSQAVDDLSALLKASVSRQAVLLLRPADGLPPILADASQVRQVLLNLAVNASEALGERGGFVTVQTGRLCCDREYLRGAILGDELPEGEYVFIEVADAGCGMDAETRKRIFEPFFSTKFTGRGLGLAAVHGILRGHGGAIHLTTEPGLGTTMRVLFPRIPEAARAPAPAPAAAPGGAVLFVDDEPALRSLAERTLQLAGYEALTAAGGAEALAVFRARAADVRVVILDLTMPGMNGDETLRELRCLHPEVRVILSSGYSEQEVSQRIGAGCLAGFLQKPYLPRDLIASVQRAVS